MSTDSSQFKPNCAGVIPFSSDLSKVVLVKTHNGVLGFPKGKIEKGKNKGKKKDSSVFQAGLREAFEETGLKEEDLTIDENVMVYEDSSKGRPGEICLFLATLKDDNFKFSPVDVEEIAWVGLMPVSEAMSLLMEKRQCVVREALMKLKT
jgi:8-oxo-dGTP pyrophosphatase MutT (NUDIX family)